jgi:hypothetical protein
MICCLIKPGVAAHFNTTFITQSLYSHNIQNPLSETPAEIDSQGVDAIMEYMSKRWLQVLIEAEDKEKKMSEYEDLGKNM